MLLSFHNIFFSLLPSAKLRRVGALYSSHARSVVSLTTDIVFSLYDMSAFRQVVKEIICHLIFWSHVISSAVATDLAHWFQTSRAFVSKSRVAVTVRRTFIFSPTFILFAPIISRFMFSPAPVVLTFELFCVNCA